MITVPCPMCDRTVPTEPVVGSLVRLTDHDDFDGTRCDYSNRRVVLSDD